MNLYDVIRRQVENVKGMLEDPSIATEDKKLLRESAATSLECAEQRGEITQDQRENLKKLLGAIDPVI